MKKIEGNLVDVYNRSIFPAILSIEEGRIINIEYSNKRYDDFIIPGFVDSHVHIESSMMTPDNFSDFVVSRGTVAAVTDPHEIANVVGEGGIDFMIRKAKEGQIKTFFSIPSCVPATPLDSSGAVINADAVERMAASGNFVALSEMMNVPGVLYKDEEVMRKIDSAKRYNLPIDGHAPELEGEQLKEYVHAGITTDHECSTVQEALDKVELGMKILIREGSSARNYEGLKYLLSECPEHVMFCTDDSHPDDLLHNGHIDKIVRRAIADGYDLFEVLKCASVNTIQHYNLPVGTLQKGDTADFIRVNNLQEFVTLATYINGEEVYNKESYKPSTVVDKVEPINNFHADKLCVDDLKFAVSGQLTSIKVEDGELLTEVLKSNFEEPLEHFEADLKRDLLKIVYYNRYHKSKPQIATINGFGLTRGAIASSVAHDSHNIIAVGTNDKDIVAAINAIVSSKGGISVVDGDESYTLALPIAGIMSSRNCETLASEWEILHSMVEKMDCKIQSPFMTLAFMSLIVIPKIKIGEKGLFDYTTFSFIEQ
ncbi:MAG: adenine deaminase [Marinifilaceae bacterium]